MEQITPYSGQKLPDNLEDLTQFVLVGKAKLQAYMLKLQTVNKLSTAQEIRDQTLKEAQEISTALIAAEQRIGELLLNIPKASGQYAESENRPVSKNTIVKEMGYSKDEASDYQRMAKNPQVVQKVIDDAIANGEIVTKESVMREIKFYKDRIKTLQEQEPEVKTVEVPPADYEKVKREAALSEAHKKDFETMKKAYDEMSNKWKRAEKEKQELIQHLNNPDEQYDRDLKSSVGIFCMGVRGFLEKYGGYTLWQEDWKQLTKQEQRKIQDCITAVYEWADMMLNRTVSEVIE